MIDVILSFLQSFTSIQYVPHMLVSIALLGLVNIVVRVATLDF